jgi:hypothetical protein
MAHVHIRSGRANQSRQALGATGQGHGGLTVAEWVDLTDGELRVSGGSSPVLNRSVTRCAEASGAPCPVVWLALDALIASSFAPPVSATGVPILHYQ